MFSYTQESLFGLKNGTNIVPSECINEEARVFVSFTCQQDEKNLLNKRQMASKIACLGVLMVFIYLTFLHYLKRKSELDFIQWDMETITPSDYTMSIKITEKMYKHYMDAIHCRYPDDPVAVRLKEYIIPNLEMELNHKL